MRVLAIGLDAAEPTLVQDLIARGELPELKALVGQGSWRKVQSPATIGSGAVWPTFITGTEPAEHGIYGEWCWHPETMSLSRYHGRNLNPFWKKLVSTGTSVGLLDLPFAPFLNLEKGFEISEWGSHDSLEGETVFSPTSVGNILDQIGQHPYTVDHLEIDESVDLEELQRLNNGSVAGVKIRGELAQRLLSEFKPGLAIVVFPEIHHASHYNWHTIAPENSIYDKTSSRGFPNVEPTLIDVYREVDRQIGRLARTVEDDTTIFVFSLHGMRPTLGVVGFLESLMRERDFARLTHWSTQSWKERSRSMLAAAKRNTPSSVKKLYYKTMPKKTTYLLARPTMMPSYDWLHTRAFAMQTDQHGRIRLNLRGRELRGIVPPEEYDATCTELESLLRSLQTTNGNQLVENVIRPAKSASAALQLLLPDLIVHWRDAAFHPALKIAGSEIDARPFGLKYTGQHAFDGFCIVAGNQATRADETIALKDLHRLICQACERPKSYHARV